MNALQRAGFALLGFAVGVLFMYFGSPSVAAMSVIAAVFIGLAAVLSVPVTGVILAWDWIRRGRVS